MRGAAEFFMEDKWSVLSCVAIEKGCGKVGRECLLKLAARRQIVTHKKIKNKR